MPLQPSASATALLLACQRPFADDVETEKDEPTVPMRYGSAFHEAMAGVNVETAALKFGIDTHTNEIAFHAMKAKEALNRWLGGENEFGVTFSVVAREQPAAWDYVTRTSRFDVKFNEADHSYECNPFELIGTADLVAEAPIDDGMLPLGRVRRVVFDYKTGDYGDFTRPDEIAQMKALAIMWDADVVAILHAPRNAPIIIYTAKFDSGKRAKAEAAFTSAMLRIGDGSMRPGDHCKRCPARTSCPTQNAELIRESNMLVRMACGGGPLANPVDKGALNQFLQIFEGLKKQAKAALKADVRAGEIIQQPNGKTLQIVTKKVERISKKSILEALGSEAGVAKLDELRALGCLTEEEEESMVAK